MTAILLLLALVLQGIPIQQGGTVTGVLRDSQGKPVAGIRIAAVARDGLGDIAATAMAGIAQTDEEGRFILENIPPGRYAIAAGRLDLQTYYPGTQAATDATVLTIAPGSTILGINFILNDTSVGRAASSGGVLAVPITATIPVSVKAEVDGKLPVTANGKTIVVSIESAADQFTVPIDDSSITISGPLAGDFRVLVENLPQNYEVKSVTYGTADITKGTFRLSSANFPSRAPSTATVATSASPPLTTSTLNLPNNEADLRAYLEALFARGISNGGAPATAQLPFVTVILNSGGATLPAKTPPSPISIVIGPATLPAGNGVRVSGTTGFTDKRTVFISGTSGTLFSDGSFEFRDVSPGRHLITAIHPYRPQAAVVVVGDRDIEGIELKQTLVPPTLQGPISPLPPGDNTPGAILPLPRILGTVVDELTGLPIGEGNVTLKTEDYTRTLSVDENGRFETLYLFPGAYDITLWVFGHTSSSETVVVGDKDVRVKLTSRKVE